jgi:cardiolipin synthase
MARGKNNRLKVFINATTRLIILSVILLLQIISVALLSYYLHNISILVLIILYAVSAVSCVFISAHHDNPATRVFWLLLIAFFPAFGLIMYLMWGKPRHGTKKYILEEKSQSAANAALATYATLCGDTGVCPENPATSTARAYLEGFGFPAFRGTQITYFPSGESFFDDCIKQMRTARKCIFISFFILREGRLWNEFHSVLREKAEQGVDVRLLLDDAGTMFNLSDDFIRDLESEGIHVRLFNPTHRFLNNLYLNYRNHQKIIVIDGDTGFTGGVNLSDEYANYTSPYGYWKDTGVRLDGQGTYGLTVAFIKMWEQTDGNLTDTYAKYYPSISKNEEGLCQVLTDGPANNPENPAEGLIYRMIESAHNYVYLTTPYLAVSQAFIELLCRVAKSGIRVVLVVPYQLDHWYVFEVTQSHFARLIDAGVEVYRFKPGMLHAKMIVADDIHALVGTINLDNRSFYSQYEDGVLFCDNKAVSAVRADIEATVAQSIQVTRADCDKIGTLRAAFGLFLRVFSPLM